MCAGRLRRLAVRLPARPGRAAAARGTAQPAGRRHARPGHRTARGHQYGGRAVARRQARGLQHARRAVGHAAGRRQCPAHYRLGTGSGLAGLVARRRHDRLPELWGRRQLPHLDHHARRAPRHGTDGRAVGRPRTGLAARRQRPGVRFGPRQRRAIQDLAPGAGRHGADPAHAGQGRRKRAGARARRQAPGLDRQCQDLYAGAGHGRRGAGGRGVRLGAGLDARQRRAGLPQPGRPADARPARGERQRRRVPVPGALPGGRAHAVHGRRQDSPAPAGRARPGRPGVRSDHAGAPPRPRARASAASATACRAA